MRNDTDPKVFKELRAHYQVLADVTRLRILAQLSRNDFTVSEIARGLRMSQPLVSWHLHRLKLAGLVKMQRNGREVHCSIDQTRLAAFARQFDTLIARD